MPRKIIAFIVCFCLIFEQAGFAQVAPQLGMPAYLQNLAPIADKFHPVHLRSISFDSLQESLDLVLDKGDERSLKQAQIEETTKKLLEYFQIGLTLPNSMFWVNLRPDAPTDVIDQYLEKTDMGKVFLEADLRLKKDLARFTDPATAQGKQYWDMLYAKAAALYGNGDIEIPTITRPWIVPGEIVVGEAQNSAYIYKATLKVMLEQDYVKDVQYNSDDERGRQMNSYSSQLVRELIIPKLTRHVNVSKQYAPLRQVYYSLILAQWFKARNATAAGQYAAQIDSKNLTGLTSQQVWSKDTYFKAYQKSFAEGEYCKDETSSTSEGLVTRRYISGGIGLTTSGAAQATVQVSQRIPIPNADKTWVIQKLPLSPPGAPVKKAAESDSPKADAKKPVRMSDAQELEQMRKYSILTQEEAGVLSERLLVFHEEMLALAERVSAQVEDVAFYTITMREQKRFIAIFLQQFSKRLKILEKKSSKVDAKDRSAAFEEAWKEAKHVYTDMFLKGEAETVSAEAPAQQESLVPAGIPYLLRDAYEKITRALSGDSGAMFMCPPENLDTLDPALDVYVQNNDTVTVERIIGTPDSDRTQLIGSKMPVEAKDRKFKDEQVRFEKGVLYRLVELAKQNPQRTYVLRLEQVEALSAKVWVQLNQYLLTGELQVPETGEKLTHPQNLKIIASLSTGLQDSAFYDRFLRKQLTPPEEAEVLEHLYKSFGVPQETVRELMKIFFNPANGLYPQQLLILLSYIKGIAVDQKVELDSDQGQQLIAQEISLFFGNRLKEMMIDDSNIPGPSLSYDPENERVLIAGVELPLKQSMKDKIVKRLKKEAKADPEILNTDKSGLKAHRLIAEVIRKATGLTFTDDVLHALSMISRSHRYGSGVVRLEGPTGTGKTFIGECLSKMMELPFYGEPFHAASRQTKLLGALRPDGKGAYIRDSNTPFLRLLANGGIIALSELNAAVKNGFARFGWLMVPIARGDSKFILNQYPRPSNGSEASPFITRSEQSIIIIDINPADDYEARGALPPMLEAYTPAVQVNGVFTKEELVQIAMDYLQDLPEDARQYYAQKLANMHFLVQEELRKDDRELSENSPHILSLRELKRCCAQITSNNASRSPKEKLMLYFLLNYQVAFRDAKDQQWIKKVAEKEIGIRKSGAAKLNKDYEKKLRLLNKILKDQGECTIYSNEKEKTFKINSVTGKIAAIKTEKIFKINPDKNKKDKEANYIIWIDDDKGGWHMADVYRIEYKNKTYNFTTSQKASIDDNEQEEDAKEEVLNDEAQDQLVQEYLIESLFGTTNATMLGQSAQNDPFKVLQASAAQRGNVHIEKINTNLFTDDSTLFGGYIPDNEAEAKSGQKEFIWADSRMINIIKQAQNDPDKIYVIAFENYHYLRPQIAVSLNALLQERVYYSPVEQEKMLIPDNVRFFASTTTEAEFELSLAEQSRWVRIFDARPERKEPGKESKQSGFMPHMDPLTQSTQYRGFGDPGAVLGPARAAMPQGVLDMMAKEVKLELRLSPKAAEKFSRMIERGASEEEIEAFLKKNIKKRKDLQIQEPPVQPKDRLTQACEDYLSKKGIPDRDRHPDPVHADELLIPTSELIKEEGQAIEGMISGKVVLAEGDPGGGKTDMGSDIAERLGLKSHIYSAHAGAHLSDFIGAYSQDEKGRTVLTCLPDKDGHFNIPFLEFYAHGGVYIFDEGAIGRRSQAIITWLTGVARGEQELVINEHPGQEPIRIKRNPHFHIIITTNPVDETPGRESIPLEVLKQCERVWVENKFSEESYTAILKRFYQLYAKMYGVAFDEDMVAFIKLNIKMHKRMQEFVDEEAIPDNPERHLLTLRDMRIWVKDFMRNNAKGMDKQEAFLKAFELNYIKQFPAPIRLQAQQIMQQEMRELAIARAPHVGSQKTDSWSVVEKTGNNVFATFREPPEIHLTVIPKGEVFNGAIQSRSIRQISVTDARKMQWQEKMFELEREHAVGESKAVKMLYDSKGKLIIIESSDRETLLVWRQQKGADFTLEEISFPVNAHINSRGRSGWSNDINVWVEAFLDNQDQLTIVAIDNLRMDLSILKGAGASGFSHHLVRLVHSPVFDAPTHLKCMMNPNGKLTAIVGFDQPDHPLMIVEEKESGDFGVDLLESDEIGASSFDAFKDNQGLLTIVTTNQDGTKPVILKQNAFGVFGVQVVETNAEGIIKKLEVVETEKGLCIAATPENEDEERTLMVWEQKDKTSFIETKLLEPGYSFGMNVRKGPQGQIVVVAGKPENLSLWQWKPGQQEMQTKILRGGGDEVSAIDTIEHEGALAIVVATAQPKTVVFGDLLGPQQALNTDEAAMALGASAQAMVETMAARWKPKERSAMWKPTATPRKKEVSSKTSHPYGAKEFEINKINNVGGHQFSRIIRASEIESEPVQPRVFHDVKTLKPDASNPHPEMNLVLSSPSAGKADSHSVKILQDIDGRRIVVEGNGDRIALWRETRKEAFTLELIDDALPKGAVRHIDAYLHENGMLSIVSTQTSDNRVTLLKQSQDGSFNRQVFQGTGQGILSVKVLQDSRRETSALTIVCGNKDSEKAVDIFDELQDGDMFLRSIPAWDTGGKISISAIDASISSEAGLVIAAGDTLGRASVLSGNTSAPGFFVLGLESEKEFEFAYSAIQIVKSDDRFFVVGTIEAMSQDHGKVVVWETHDMKNWAVVELVDHHAGSMSACLNSNNKLRVLCLNSNFPRSGVSGFRLDEEQEIDKDGKHVYSSRSMYHNKSASVYPNVSNGASAGKGGMIFVSAHTSGQMILWQDGMPMVDALEPDEMAQLRREQEEFLNRGSLLETEEEVQQDMQDIFDLGSHCLLLLEPGAGEQEIIDGFAGKHGYQVVSLEGVPDMTALELIGGLFPILEGEETNGRSFREKPGFLRRNMVAGDGKGIEGEKKLLVLHNVDAMPERVRAALNNFLLKGYLELKDDSGKTQRYYLPPTTHIVATMSSSSQRDFSSAFFNRFIKLDVPAMTAFEDGYSELLQLLWRGLGLGENEARKIQNVYLLIKRMCDSGDFWPSGSDYKFTVKEAILHGIYVKNAIAEARQAGAVLDQDGILRLVATEAIRLYGGRVIENRNDYDNLMELVLKRIFAHYNVEELAGQVLLDDGFVQELSGVRVPDTGMATRREEVDPRYRLTLVPAIVKTMSSLIRGWQAGKIVSIVGETGAAKTTMGVFLAQMLFGKDNPEDHYYIYSTHGESRARDLQVQLQMTSKGTFKLEVQEFVRRVEKGNQVLIIDEANMRPEILWAINGIARGAKEISIEIPGEKPFTIKVGKNVFILLTMNPESYTDRGEVPLVLLENIVKLWAPIDYSKDEVSRILRDLVVAAEQKQLRDAAALPSAGLLSQANVGLGNAMHKLTLEALLQVIELQGSQALAGLSKKDLKELESELLNRADVQEKIRKIRSLSAFFPGAKLIFSASVWWEMSMDGKTINIPLYELANPARSAKAVIGLIIHEFRHKRWTLKSDQIEEWAALSQHIADINDSLFGPLLNITEDIRIDNMHEKGLEGENEYLDATAEEFMGLPLSEQQIMTLIQTSQIDPFSVLKYMLLRFARTGKNPEYLDRLPQPLQAAFEQITSTPESKAMSMFDRATISENVKIDFDGILQGHKNRDDEITRAAQASLEVLCGEILPICRALAGQAQSAQGVDASGQPGKSGEGEATQGQHGKPGEGQPEQRADASRGAGKMPGEAPSFNQLTDEEMQQVIDNLSPEALAELAEALANSSSGSSEAGGEAGSGQGISIPMPQGTAGSRSGGRNGSGGQGQTSAGDEAENAGKDEVSSNEESTESPKFMDPSQIRQDNLELNNIETSSKEIRQRRMMQNEPLNYRLSQSPQLGKKLAEILINLFRLTDEQDTEPSSTGWTISPERYVVRDPEPFDIIVEILGKLELAIGLTIDCSGSMQRYNEAIQNLLAIYVNTFEKIGAKKAEYSISVVTTQFDEIKKMKDRLKKGELNQRHAEMEGIIRAGGIRDKGNGIGMYNAVRDIIEKYEHCNKKNKIELVLTDGQDVAGDVRDGKPSERLQKKLAEAKRKKIEIIGIGFNSTPDVEAFDKYIKLNDDNVELVVEAMFMIALEKTRHGKLPEGDLLKKLKVKGKRRNAGMTNATKDGGTGQKDGGTDENKAEGGENKAAAGANKTDIGENSGGIDMRALPIAARPVEAFGVMHSQGVSLELDPKVAAVLNQDWIAIMQQVQSEAMPYAKIKEYVVRCKQQNAQEQLDAVFICITNILRLEEDVAVSTPQELKEILTTIG
jgi:MoxR-like ATPase